MQLSEHLDPPQISTYSFQQSYKNISCEVLKAKPSFALRTKFPHAQSKDFISKNPDFT